MKILQIIISCLLIVVMIVFSYFSPLLVMSYPGISFENDYEIPYDGAKEMLLVDVVDSKEFLTKLFTAMYDELPAPKKKK